MSPRPPARRAYDRLCPLSLALDQVGDRWTLHILMALLGGPKRYAELKKLLTGAGTNILSDRLRGLAANGLVSRTTGNAPGTETLHESYQWRIDGIDLELAVRGDKIIRTPGRAARPAVTLTASNTTLASLVTGGQSVAEAIEHGHMTLKGSKTAIRRMFDVIGFPLVRLGF